MSLVFCKGLLALRAAVSRAAAGDPVVQPAIGGLVIGVMLVYSPAIMGVGYEYVDQALNGGLLLKTMVVLCASSSSPPRSCRMRRATPAASSRRACTSARWPAGRWAWSSTASRRFRPPIPGAYALVGMGTLFAGIIRAPMTSVFMIFEITQDYQILVPLMVANLLSFVISRRYQPVPVYHALLHQDGVHLPLGNAQTPAATRTARQVMQTEVTLIPPDASIEQAWQVAVAHGAPAYLVGTSDHLLGAVLHQQLDESMRGGQATSPVASIVDRLFVHTHLDHPVDVVLDRFAQSGGILPVVSRADVQKLEGVVTIDSILAFTGPRSHAAGRRPRTTAATAAQPAKPSD